MCGNHSEYRNRPRRCRFPLIKLVAIHMFVWQTSPRTPARPSPSSYTAEHSFSFRTKENAPIRGTGRRSLVGRPLLQRWASSSPQAATLHLVGGTQLQSRRAPCKASSRPYGSGSLPFIQPTSRIRAPHRGIARVVHGALTLVVVHQIRGVERRRYCEFALPSDCCN